MKRLHTKAKTSSAKFRKSAKTFQKSAKVPLI